MANKKVTTFKIGRDAGTGKFFRSKSAQAHKKTAIVQTIKKTK